MKKRIGLVAILTALALAATASPATAVTIGQLAPDPSSGPFCSADADRGPASTVSSGNSYVVPSTGGVTDWTLTSWSHNATAGMGQMLTMKVFRKVGDPARYMAVGHDGPRALTPSMINTFPVSIPVKPGDFLGSNSLSPAAIECIFPAGPGNSFLLRSGNLADGESGDFPTTSPYRLNISAVVVPTNTFTIGAVRRNKKKGTATTMVSVPNPGELTGSGKGAKVTPRAVTSRSVGAGQTGLLIKAKGKKKRKLNETGKVKLKVGITYTPAGGDPHTQSLRIKLKKEL